MSVPASHIDSERKRHLAAEMQITTLRIASYDVIAALTRALQYPTICRRELETAMAALPKAYAAACQLDPKEDESDL